MNKLFSILLISTFSCFAMEQDLQKPSTIEMIKNENLKEINAVSSGGIILVSDNSKNFLVNEEVVHNVPFLQQNRVLGINKILTKHNEEVLGFVVEALNNPLGQDELIKNKIALLQESTENNVTLSDYSSALNDYGIKISQIIKELPTEQKIKPTVQKMSVESDVASESDYLRLDYEFNNNQHVSSRAVRANNSTCCRDWQCHEGSFMNFRGVRQLACCSFTALSFFKNCCCCFIMGCDEKDGRCYICCIHDF